MYLSTYLPNGFFVFFICSVLLRPNITGGLTHSSPLNTIANRTHSLRLPGHHPDSVTMKSSLINFSFMKNTVKLKETPIRVTEPSTRLTFFNAFLVSIYALR